MSASRLAEPVEVQVTIHDAQRVAGCAIAAMPFASPRVQVSAAGEILIAGSRCRHTASGAERNAIFYDADGCPQRDGILGDGIHHMALSQDSQIWVGYIDDGIHGNFGWGHRSGPTPVGAAGIVRFDSEFQPDWHFPEDHPFGSVDDCEALNVCAGVAWACTYIDYPLLRIAEGKVDGWHNSAGVAEALVVAGDQVALVGGSRRGGKHVTVGNVAGDALRIDGRRALALPDGHPIPASSVIVGQGHELHVIAYNEWFKVDLADLRDPD